MRKIKYVLLLLFLCCIIDNIKAQAPQAISFQAIIRNNNQQLVKNQSIGMRLSILKGNTSGNVMYSEIHQPNSNFQGLVILEIGKGTIVSGVFANINWGNDNYFLKIETDISGGNNYQLMGINKFEYIPYALYAEKGGTPGAKGKDGISIIDADLQNDSLVFILADNTEINAGKINGDNGIFVSQALVVNDSFILKLSDSSSINTGRISQHYIGELYGGGVVFHVYYDSLGQQHGLIVGLDDLSQNSVWSNVDTISLALDVNVFWDGKANTQAIINQAGHQYSAAYVCDTSTAQGFTDWYLPSMMELQKLIQEIMPVNYTLINTGAYPLFYFYSYWASNDWNGYVGSKGNYAYCSHSDVSALNRIYGAEKSDDHQVIRAIRAF